MIYCLYLIAIECMIMWFTMPRIDHCRSTFESAKDVWQSTVNQAKIKHGHAPHVQTSFGQGQRNCDARAGWDRPSTFSRSALWLRVSLSCRSLPGSADFLCQFVAQSCLCLPSNGYVKWNIETVNSAGVAQFMLFIANAHCHRQS